MKRLKQPHEAIPIDGTRLDLECVELPSHIGNAAVALADAKSDHTQAENRLTLISSQLMLKARRTPKAYALPDKPGVDLLKAWVVTTKKYQDALNEVTTAKRKADALAALLNALESKKRLLGNLVDLHCTNYHSEVRQPPTPEGRDSRKLAQQRSVAVAMRPGEE